MVQREPDDPFLLKGRKPTAIIVLFLSLQILIPAWLVFPGLGEAGRPAAAIGVGMLVLWIGAWILPDGHRSGRQPVRWFIGGYLLTTLAAYAAAYDRGLPTEEASGADRWLLTTLAMCGLGLFVVDVVRSRHLIDHILLWLTRLLAVMSIIGIIQATTGFDVAAEIRIPGLVPNRDPIGLALRGDAGFARATGTAMHSIEFGVVLACVAPIAIHYALFAKTRRQRVIRWITAGVIMFGVPLSLSRGATIGIVVTIGLLALVWPWRARLNLLVLAFAALLVYRMIQPGILGTIVSSFQYFGNDPSVQNRLSDYGPASDYISTRPWLGRGYGTFLPNKYLLLDNQLLLTTISAGIIGLIGMLLLYLGPYFLARSVRLRGLTEETRHLAQALAATTVALLATAATFDALWYGIYNTLLFTTIGMIGVLWRLDRDHGWRSLQPAPPDARFVGSPIMAPRRVPRPPFLVRKP